MPFQGKHEYWKESIMVKSHDKVHLNLSIQVKHINFNVKKLMGLCSTIMTTSHSS